MVSSLRHKRSAMALISPPFPTSSSTMLFETADGHRSSGESQIPSDGYSSLFTSGFLRQPLASPTLSAFPSPPKIVRGPFHPSSPAAPQKSPVKRDDHLLAPCTSSPSPTKTPVRRRRSSILHTTQASASPRAFKSAGPDGGVERALDNVMRSLKVIAMGSPRRSVEVSRWSSSSEESMGMSEESGFWKPRKSGESTRSKATVGTMKSSRSVRSKKSRKSEDTDRMEIDEDIPPVPVPVPTTPGRSRRMMNGLVKRLGLTPKKNKPSTPTLDIPDIPLDLPQPPSVDRDLPRKSSFSTLRSALTKKSSTGTLRSIAKKSSTGTLRSVKSTRSLAHPFVGTGPTFDCEMNPPPLPRWKDGEHGDGCLPMPTTPRGRRTPKTSIGQPRLQPSTSPSIFLKDMPRRAPGTPKAEEDDLPDLPTMPELQDFDMFGTPVMPGLDTPSMYTDHDTPLGGYGSPSLDTPVHPDDRDAAEIISFNHTPLTARGAALRPKRLVHLLPRGQRENMGLQTPPSVLRAKKSSQNVANVLRAGTPLQARHPNVPYPHTPDSLRSVPRDPLGIISRSHQPTYPGAGINGAAPLPFRLAGGGGRSARTPVLAMTPEPSTGEKKSRFADEGTFGHSPIAAVKQRRPVPDFTASPVKSTTTTRNSMGSMNTDESHLPSEEWELEAYLKELDRVDREREVGVGR